MKKVLKRMVSLILSMILVLGVWQTPVYAWDDNGQGNQGGGGTLNLNGKDGINPFKAGWLVWVSDSSGHPIMGKPVTAISAGGYQPTSTSGAYVLEMLITRFGDKATRIQYQTKAPWGGNPATMTGDAITAWLKNPQKGYDSGAAYVLVDILGFSKDEVDSLMTQGEIYLNCESWWAGGVYVGSTHSGIYMIGTPKMWASLTQPSNWLGRYTHQVFVNANAYKESWLGLSVPSSLTVKHSSEEIRSAVGLGISSIRLKPGDRQVIKCYYTAGKLDNTSYSFADESYEIKDEGSYKAKDWFVSEKKSNRSGDTEFSSFQSELPSTRTGHGVSTITFTPKEKALVIKYERQEEPVVREQNEDAIRAHELNYIFRYADGKRDEVAGEGRSYAGANFTFNSVKSQYERHTSDTVQGWYTDEDYEVIESHDGDVVGFQNAGHQVHYYNEAVSDPIWLGWDDVKDPFGLDENISPHYAYNVSRYLWEPELVVCEYREGNTGYASDVLGFTVGKVGALSSADMSENTESTLGDTKADHYEYTAQLQEYWQERDYLGEEYSDGNSYESADDAPEGVTSTSIYSDWRDMEGTISHIIEAATVDIEHYCDKYRVTVTPQASIPTAGEINTESRGGTNLGHDYIATQIVNAQLHGTGKLWAEVPYTQWVTSELVNYAEPTNEIIYMMGEYEKQFTPPTLHGYATTITNNSAVSTLSSPQTGYYANEVSDFYMNNGLDITGVIPQGTSFEVASLFQTKMYIGSTIFDITEDDGLKSAWGNDWIDAESSHSGYAEPLAAMSDLQLYMQLKNSNGTNHGDVYKLNSDKSDTVRNDEERIVKIKFANGAIVEGKGELIDAISWSYGYLVDGSSIYAKWGLEEMLDKMFISTTDPKEMNASGNDLAGSSALSRNDPWYDEESIAIEFKVFRTELTFQQQIATDKIEYNLLRQSNANRYADVNVDASNSLYTEFFSRLYLLGNEDMEMMLSADGYGFDHTSTVRWDKLNTTFAISSQTTDDRHK